MVDGTQPPMLIKCACNEHSGQTWPLQGRHESSGYQAIALDSAGNDLEFTGTLEVVGR
jgi:hypothetical protein